MTLKEMRCLAALNEEFCGQDADVFLQRFFRDTENMDIVVIGSYSDGKSTFLNTLLMLDQVLLPTGSRPTTAKPWRLSYGNRTTVWGMKADGRKIFEKGWKEIIQSQKSEDDNQLDYYDVQISSRVIDVKNIVIWDMPGFDDHTHLYDPQEAEELIQRHEVVIFICCWENHNKLDDILKNIFEAGHYTINVILTNAKNNENFADRRHHYLEKMRGHFQSKLPGASFKIYALDSVQAMRCQKRLDQFAHDLDQAVHDFLEHKDLETIIKNWTAELQNILEELQQSGIIEVRRAVKEIIEDADKIIDQRICQMLQRVLGSIIEAISIRREEYQKQLTSLQQQHARLCEKRRHSLGHFEQKDVILRLDQELVQYFDRQKNKLAQNFLGDIQEFRSQAKPGRLWGIFHPFWGDKEAKEAQNLFRLMSIHCLRRARETICKMAEELPITFRQGLAMIFQEEKSRLNNQLSGNDLGGIVQQVTWDGNDSDLSEESRQLQDMLPSVLESVYSNITEHLQNFITKESINNLNEEKLSDLMAKSVSYHFQQSILQIKGRIAELCLNKLNKFFSGVNAIIDWKLSEELLEIENEISEIEISLERLDEKLIVAKEFIRKIEASAQGG